jgi:hypothetical protein
LEGRADVVNDKEGAMKRHAAVAAFAFLLAAAVSAQEQTASIQGVVRDAGGGVVPGVTVTASDARGLAVPTVTDESGRYWFPSLPPGRFALTTELAGFAPVRVENVDLHLGQELTVPITLERATLSETVQVVAESPAIAVTQSARTESLRSDEIDRLPNSREFQDVVIQVSGANQEDTRAWGFLSIDGSSVVENRFIVDGVEITDPTYGVSNQGNRLLVTDFMDEIQVKSSGYTAEYGGSTGGVVNALTKSGTNEWHGEGLLFWKADWLDAEPRPTLQLNPGDSDIAEHVTYPKDEYRSLEPGFTLGGPILRDRLWFFGGYIPQWEPTDRTAPFADDTVATLRRYRKSHQALATLTGQAGPQWRFRTSVNMGRTRAEGVLQNQDGTSDPTAAYDEVIVQPSWSLSGSVDWIPRPDFFMSLRAGYFTRDWYKENVYIGDLLSWQTSSMGIPGVPPAYQQGRGYRNAPTNLGWDREKQGHLGLQWDSTFFFSAAGQHQLKAGVQVDRRTLDVLGGATGNVVDLYWNQSFIGQRGAYGYYQVESNSILPNRGSIRVGEARSTNIGLFVQDGWTIGQRLTLNLGLRTENENVPSFSQDPDIPDTAVNWGFGEKLAPRLGFAWDVTGDGRTKLYGSWGVFYDIMKLFMPLAFGGQFATYDWYTLDDPNISRIENNLACPPDCPGTFIYEYVLPLGRPINDPEDPTVDPDLQPVKLQEAVLGLEREITSDLTVGVRYVHKQLDRLVEDMGLRDANGNEIFRIGNPGFGLAERIYPDGGTESLPYPRARRDYDAVELTLDKRMSGRWSGRLSYLWSRLYGNTAGIADPDFRSVGPNVSPAWDHVFMPFGEDGQPVYGVLATDRTHQVKARLLYDLPFGTVVGASWYGVSGIPRSRRALFVPGGYYQVHYPGRGTEGRNPFLSRLDLQVQQRFHLGDKVDLTLMATVFNVFDQASATDSFPNELFQGQAVDISETDFFAGFDTQQLIEEQGLVRDARFLMDWFYQPPRTIRLGMRLDF